MKLVQGSPRYSPAGEEGAYIDGRLDKTVAGFQRIGDHIDRMCRGRKLVLMIDEADKTGSNRGYYIFRGCCRTRTSRGRL